MNPIQAIADAARVVLAAGPVEPSPPPPVRQPSSNPKPVPFVTVSSDEEPEGLSFEELLRQIRNATVDPFSDKGQALKEIRDLIDGNYKFPATAAGGAPVGSKAGPASPTGAPDYGDAA